jgi:D-3-phosphoglycerate dehydrogenase
MRCLLVQPIHEAGRARLEGAGIGVSLAASPAMPLVAREIGDCDAVITRDAGLSAEAIEAGRRLRIIVSHGAGYDRIDIDAASRRGIPVANTPGRNAQSVAELAVGLMLAAARRLPAADRSVREGNIGFREQTQTIELAGKTAFIVGWGNIGRATAHILREGFGMKVLAFSPRASPDIIERAGACKAETLEEGLSRADIVSLHAPLNAETRALLNDETFGAFRPGAILVNTARAGLIDESALAQALDLGVVLAAGLDLHEAESPLLGRDDVILTPHLGGSTRDSLERTALAAAECVIDAMEGRLPASVLNAAILQRNAEAR